MRARIIILTIGTIYLAGCLILAVILGEFAFHPARVPIDKRPEAEAMAARFGAELQDVSTHSDDGTSLEAWFVRPNRAAGNAVILLHGIGDNRQGMLGLAELFLAHGFSVLLPDSRGQGTSGGILTYGVKERNDVRQWFEWLNGHEKPRCIYGMGESMGAAIALQSIREVPFCAVVAESPFANFRDIAWIRVGQFFGSLNWLGRLALRPAMEFAFLYCRFKYGVSLSSVSPERSVIGNRVPVLLIHGMSDTNVPYQQSERIFRRNPSSITFWRVPNAGHCGAMNADGREFETRVFGWLSSLSNRSSRSDGLNPRGQLPLGACVRNPETRPLCIALGAAACLGGHRCQIAAMIEGVAHACLKQRRLQAPAAHLGDGGRTAEQGNTLMHT